MIHNFLECLFGENRFGFQIAFYLGPLFFMDLNTDDLTPPGALPLKVRSAGPQP